MSAPTPGGARRLAINVSTGWGQFLANVVVSLALTPFVIHRTGLAAYGVYLLAESILGYSSYLYMGLGSAIARYAAAFRGTDDRAAIRDLAGTVFAVYLLSGFTVVVLSWVLAPLIPRLFNVDPALAADTVFVVRVLGLSVGLAFPASAFSGLLRGYERIAELNVLSLVALLARAALTVTLLQPTGAIRTLALISLAITVIDVVGRLVLCWRILGMIPTPLGFRRPMLKRISGFSVLSFLGDIAERVLFKTDNIVVGAFLPESMVSAYAIPARLIDYPRQLVRRMGHTFSPRFALLSARGEDADLRDLAADTARWATLLILPFSCGLTFLGADFIEVWIGERLPDAEWVLGLLCLAQLVRAPAIILAGAVWGTGRLRGATIAITSEAVANLLLSLWWIQTWGLPGVAAGTAVPALVYSFVVIPLILQSVTGMDAAGTLARVWRRPLLVALPSAVVYAILPAMHPVTVGGLIVRIAAGVVVSAVATWFVGLDGSERRWLQAKLIGRWRRSS